AVIKTGSAGWDERRDDGSYDRVDDWKLQQGNLGPEPDEDLDADMYAFQYLMQFLTI
ncbi:cellulose synthase A catalytic subunit 7, partial [Trifolium medium]|nr:cellulose synthase A catalytic subunit 7 [Trifolium medium]